MKHLLRTAVLLIASMVSFALFLVSLYFLIGNIRSSNSTPAHFLPNEQTQAILHSPDSNQLQIWSSIFPELKNTEEQSDAVAIVALHEKTRAAVSFRKVQHSSEATVGNFAVRSSDARVIPLLETDGETVHASKDYPKLVNAFGDVMWMYIQSSVVEEIETLVSSTLEKLLYGQTAHRGIAKGNEETLTIVTHSKETYDISRASKDIVRLPNLVLLISTASMSKGWEQLRSFLQPESALIAEGFVRELTLTLGKDISMDYDILPLLQEPSTFYLTQTGSVTSFLLEGSLKSTAVREKIIDRLHIAFKEQLSTARITKRRLDKRFSTVDIRHDPNLIEEKKYTLNGWVIRITRHTKEGRHLATASKGSKFIVSDTTALLETAITERTSLQVPTFSKKAILRSAGYVDRIAFAELLEWWLPLVERKASVLEGEGTLFWAIAEDDAVRFVHTKIEEGNSVHSLDSHKENR